MILNECMGRGRPMESLLFFFLFQVIHYCRLLLHQGRLIGAVLYGDTRHGPWYFEQALAATDLTACRHLLLFGATDAQTALDNHFDNPLDTLSSPLSLTREAA